MIIIIIVVTVIIIIIIIIITIIIIVIIIIIIIIIIITIGYSPFINLGSDLISFPFPYKGPIFVPIILTVVIHSIANVSSFSVRQ